MKWILLEVMPRHMEYREVTRDSQCGCTKGRSCLSNPMAARCTVTVSVDEGGAADVIYLDFCKAYDSVIAPELEDMGLVAGLSG